MKVRHGEQSQRSKKKVTNSPRCVSKRDCARSVGRHHKNEEKKKKIICFYDTKYLIDDMVWRIGNRVVSNLVIIIIIKREIGQLSKVDCSTLFS